MTDDPEKIRIAQGARLRRVREAARFSSARAAAIAAGWPESTYRAHEAGARTIGPDDAARYVDWFLKQGAGGKFSGQWVIYGDGEEVSDEDIADLLRGESAAFRRRAYDAVMNLKKR